MSTLASLRRFSVDDYYRMAETGILTPRDRVELIHGEVRTLSPIGNRHACMVDQLNMLLVHALMGRTLISVQNPIRLSHNDEPQPDLTVKRLRADRYAKGHATAADIHWLIEVADTTLAYDRDEKIPYYAANGVKEAWLVDLVHDQLIVYAQPSASGYQQSSSYPASGAFATTDFPDLVIKVGELFRI